MMARHALTRVLMLFRDSHGRAKKALSKLCCTACQCVPGLRDVAGSSEPFSTAKRPPRHLRVQ
jgi:hypothetical protein